MPAFFKRSNETTFVTHDDVAFYCNELSSNTFMLLAFLLEKVQRTAAHEKNMVVECTLQLNVEYDCVIY